ncbi:MAG: Fe-S protein assembly co-chaperone HscB [Planctomycetota bacterium]
MDDPFELLGIEPVFELDPSTLQAQFLSASARCHPDRFTDPLEQADAADRMSRVTQAYRQLSDPESRAHALLALRGDSADTEGEATKALPPDLLMEMMEVREALDDAIALGDQPSIEKHRDWAQQKQADYLTSIGKLFEEPPSEQNSAAIRLELNALRYMVRMLEQMPA